MKIIKRSNNDFLDNLLDYVIDHLKHFRAYPVEFEYKDKIYSFKEYMKVLNKRKL